MSSTTVLVPLEKYLNTAYRPDVDYVDDHIERRNVGDPDHGRLQGLIAAYLAAREREWAVFVYTETRTRCAERRYRIPDIAVTRSLARGQAISEPPLLCIEILSRRDRPSRMKIRIGDFLRFGVPHVWVIDPRKRRAWVYTPDGSMSEAHEGVLTAGKIRVPLWELGD